MHCQWTKPFGEVKFDQVRGGHYDNLKGPSSAVSQHLIFAGSGVQ